MDLKSAIATLICPRYPFGADGLDFGDGGDRPLPGGFCCFSVDLPASLDHVAELRGRTPGPFPYVCSDLERGAGWMIPRLTRLPPALAFGAAGSESLARRAGIITAEEARRATISWIFAPVVDLLSEPTNPIVATRAYSRDPSEVARLAGAFAAGVRDGGALATAKHYPGHGATTVDSHLVLPEVTRDLATIEAEDEAPYRALAAAGVDAVMLGHLLVPAIDPRNPTSLSAATVTRLRETLGFHGLVVTDALDMGAIPDGETVADEPAVRAIRAGADVALLPRDPDRAARALLVAVETGLLSGPELIQRAERIRTIMSGISTPPQPTLARSPGGDELALEVARASVCATGQCCVPWVERDVDVALIDDGGGRESFPALIEALNRAEVRARPLGDRTPDPDRSLLIAVFSEVRHSKGRVTLDAARCDSLESLRAAAGEHRTLSLGCPQALLGGPPEAPIWYVFDRDPASLQAAAEVVSGRLEARGRPCWVDGP